MRGKGECCAVLERVASHLPDGLVATPQKAYPS
jgi:hypothetical protein